VCVCVCVKKHFILYKNVHKEVSAGVCIYNDANVELFSSTGLGFSYALLYNL